MKTIRTIALLLPVAALTACGVDADPARITADGDPSEVVLVPVCVQFDVPAVGDTAGGAYGDSPGDVIFTENGIPVSVHTFHHPPGQGTAFGYTTVVDSFPLFGNGQIAHTSNINLGFDFTGLAFVPSSVKFEGRDYGGHENLKVNGSGIHVGELTASPAAMGGTAVSHVGGWSPGFVFKQGTTTITGNVSVLGVGGQELYLDNVCAYP